MVYALKSSTPHYCLERFKGVFLNQFSEYIAMSSKVGGQGHSRGIFGGQQMVKIYAKGKNL